MATTGLKHAGAGPAGGPRAAAARALAEVISAGHTLEAALPAYLEPLPDERDRAFAQELCYGTLRWFFRLDFIAGRLLNQPLRARDADVRGLLLCGLYQLDRLDVAEHAAVSETVQAARAIYKDWASGLLNAVLRRYIGERHRLESDIARVPSAKLAHPDWFMEALRREWPEHWEPCLAANNTRPPLDLRVNVLRSGRDACHERLAAAGIGSTALPGVESGLRLAQATGPERLPGFADGDVSVQDHGAQFAALLLDLRAGQRVLDACAAPGGKTAHILEHTPDIAELTALDRSEERLARLRSNLARLGLHATVTRADATRAQNWWDGRPYDRILLDAPCSATGVIRRHPDIKLLRRPAQLPLYHGTQAALLDSMWPLLDRGGLLLYSTCSVLRSENDDQIEKFLSNHKDVRVLQPSMQQGIATGFGRQLLPGTDDTDGFYYALLGKN